MKRTGPTKQETREIIVGLEKTGKSTSKQIWKDLAEKLNRATRQRSKVNVFQLNKLAKKNKGKILVVPGKVLGTGSIDEVIEVACLSCSDSAREKIESMEGKVIELSSLVNSKTEAKKMVIIQ
ncbi:MAG: 50S ribosomal protein L18e [Candidatus Diapherotrites archaeon CG11_big_fil_rev_8_21_14_0_20_37_9]|nr:MAG: 50S ribosomal protein L18e [Candidatus Diapherotrites archaeon CG11_big_fil_rev_8_21_14_0_20_37_9]